MLTAKRFTGSVMYSKFHWGELANSLFMNCPIFSKHNYAKGNSQESIALTAAMTLPSLLL